MLNEFRARRQRSELPSQGYGLCPAVRFDGKAPAERLPVMRPAVLHDKFNNMERHGVSSHYPFAAFEDTQRARAGKLTGAFICGGDRLTPGADNSMSRMAVPPPLVLAVFLRPKFLSGVRRIQHPKGKEARLSIRRLSAPGARADRGSGLIGQTYGRNMTKKAQPTKRKNPIYKEAHNFFVDALDPLMCMAAQLPALHAEFDELDRRRNELSNDTPQWHQADNRCRLLLGRMHAVENAILHLPAKTMAAAAVQVMLASCRVDGHFHVGDEEQKNIIPGLESAFLAMLSASGIDPKSIGAQYYMAHLLQREAA